MPMYSVSPRPRKEGSVAKGSKQKETILIHIEDIFYRLYANDLGLGNLDM